MSYTALYRKYRPRLFSGVVGQTAAVKTIRNQIISGRVTHAYLFCGTRGTGKTSVAKIFARAVNCERPDGGEPCGECAFCRSADAAQLAVFEIDAASNNGVDNIRDLIGAAAYPPAVGRRKVYIIDEAHMLSAGAFNALLKTLEEPPPHVMFILATTEPHKIPPTIQSRCQRFDFRRIPREDVTAALAAYLSAEGAEADADALAYVARVSDGAMRDALSIMDQCLSYYFGERITLEMVRDVCGAVDGESLFALTDALLAGDADAVQSVVDGAAESGKDAGRLCSEMVSRLRDLIVALTAGGGSAALDVSAPEAARLAEQAKKAGKDELIRMISAFADLQNTLRFDPNDRALFEVCCFKYIAGRDERPAAQAPAAAPTDPAFEARLARIERMIEKAAAGKQPARPAPPPDRGDVKRALEGWADFVRSVRTENAPLAGFLDGASAGESDGGILVVTCQRSYDEIELRKRLSELTALLAKRFGRSFTVRLNAPKPSAQKRADEMPFDEFARLFGE
ncbi:MAG: DNA polymerase III subunit gamma/tau [Clostridiales bacterium]|nr:DNA polymerase III subunit gamma/tau [Clostridiales bacterium]